MKLLSNDALERIHASVKILGTEITDWLIVKKYLVHYFKSEDALLFSNRQSGSGKHILNEYDKSIIDYWEKITGIRLVLDPEKNLELLPPKKAHGWRLIELNKAKARQKRLIDKTKSRNTVNEKP